MPRKLNGFALSSSEAKKSQVEPTRSNKTSRIRWRRTDTVQMARPWFQPVTIAIARRAAATDVNPARNGSDPHRAGRGTILPARLLTRSRGCAIREASPESGDYPSGIGIRKRHMKKSPPPSALCANLTGFCQSRFRGCHLTAAVFFNERHPQKRT